MKHLIKIVAIVSAIVTAIIIVVHFVSRTKKDLIDSINSSIRDSSMVWDENND